MIAAKHFDPQIGLDVHGYSAPPGPYPTPVLGLILDPFDYLPFIGATVLIGGVMRANAGVGGFILHIFVGTPTPPPKAPGGPQIDSELFTGSKIVLSDDEPQSRLGDLVLTCNLVGMIPPPRLKKMAKPKPLSLTLPTTLQLTIPVNALVGGPPMISLSTMLFKGAFAALKGLGKLYKAVARRVFKNMKPGFLKCKILRAEPVDIRDGSVSVEHLDFELPGRLPLAWVRNYSSTEERVGACGYGWDTLADLRLEREKDGSISFCGPDQVALFPHLPPENAGEGEYVLDLFDGARLLREGAYWVVQTKDGLRYQFGEIGDRPQLPFGNWGLSPISPSPPPPISLIERIEDANGNHWRFERQNGRLMRIVESGAAGRKIDVQTSPEGLIESLTLIDPATGARHRLVTYRYTRGGDLEAAIDELDAARRFAYVDHRMVRHTDRLGLSFHYAYDSQWRVIHAWGDEGQYDYHFVYDEILRQREITDSLGHTTVIKLDENNLPLCEIDPLGGVTVFEYDDAGRTVAVTAPEGLRTEFEYDAYGNLLSTMLPDNSCISTAYDDDHNPVSITDPEGGKWCQEWDERGNLIRQSTPGGAATQYEYTEQGDLKHVTDPAGQRTSLDYDPLGFLAGLTDAVGQRAQFGHDIFGNLLAKQLANGDTTHYRYDAKNRLVDCALPDAKRIQCAYDAEDNLTCYRAEAGRETRFTYYCQGSLQSRTDPDGSRVEYHYDTEEQLIGVSNQKGQRWQLKRDAIGRLIEEIDYWGQSRQYDYTPAGHLACSTDPLGQVLTITCDKLGRITEKQASDGDTETYRYNRRGQLTEAKNPFSTIEREYNEDGQLIQEKQNQADVEAGIDYFYNPAGQLIEQTQQLRHQQQKARFEQTQKYTYNALGQPESVQIDEHEPIWFTFDEIGRITHQQQNAHLAQHYHYNQAGQLTRQGSTLKGQLQTRIDYEYDEAGNLIKRDDQRIGTDQYRYDLLGQITAHADPTGKVRRFVYDKTGDRFKTVKEDQHGRTLQHEDGSVWRLDKAGQLIQKEDAQGESTRLEWDAYGRLRFLIPTSTESWEYRYDALGRRICKSRAANLQRGIPAETVWFVWDGDAMVGEIKRQTVGETKTYSAQFYTYHLGSFVPLAMQVQKPENQNITKSLYYYQNDPNGMPLRLNDEYGIIAWEAHYTAFGRADWLGANKVTQLLRLQGQYFDAESGLHYNRYRYYDAAAGCFISQDPIGLSGGFNLYQYARNSVHWTDPLGLHQAYADLDGIPIICPDSNSGLWEHDWGSSNAPLGSYGAKGHSEAKLLEYLQNTKGKEGLSGKTLTITSLGQMSNDGRKILSPLPPCPNCEIGLSQFAKNNKMSIEYRWEDSKGKMQSMKWDENGKKVKCG